MTNKDFNELIKKGIEFDKQIKETIEFLKENKDSLTEEDKDFLSKISTSELKEEIEKLEDNLKKN